MHWITIIPHLLATLVCGIAILLIISFRQSLSTRRVMLGVFGFALIGINRVLSLSVIYLMMSEMSMEQKLPLMTVFNVICILFDLISMLMLLFAVIDRSSRPPPPIRDSPNYGER